MTAYSLENEFLRVEIENQDQTISIFEKQISGIEIKNAYLDMKYSKNGKTYSGRRQWENCTISSIEPVETVHGSGQRRFVTIPNDDNLVHTTVEFILLDNSPKLLWKMKTHNNGDTPIYMERMEMFRVGYMIVTSSVKDARKTETGSIQIHPDATSLVFYSNGWQSWAFSGTYNYFEKYRKTKLDFVQGMMNYNPGTPKPKKAASFASDMYALYGDIHHKKAVVVGFLSQKKHFGSLEALTHSKYSALRMWANGDHTRIDPGQMMETDWAYFMPVDLTTEEPLAEYYQDVAQEHGIADKFKQTEIPQGWCSWYEHFENISEEIILANLDTADEIKAALPLDLIQIDDGYQTKVGDWLTTREVFPNGIKPIAQEIKAKGFTPGLWMAPFSISQSSQVFVQHPEWILKYENQPVRAGWLPQWGKGQSTALDLTNPEAKAYLHHFIKTVVEDWGIDYLKLDFLYSAAVECQYQDPTKTRAQVLRMGLETIREAAGPQTRILGCGCPLGPAIGLVDAMRIGPDVEETWLPQFKGIKFIVQNEPSMPSARLAIRNTIERTGMHRRWWINDPDCLLLRPNAKLTMDEIQSLTTTIGMSGGSMLLSDDMPNLPEDRFRLAQVLMPIIGKRPIVPDQFKALDPRQMRLDLEGPIGKWHLISHLNWSNKPTALTLKLRDYGIDPNLEYIAHEFWTGAQIPVKKGQIKIDKLAAHGTALYALYPKTKQAQYIGCNLHLSQGLEVTSWKPTSDVLNFTIETIGTITGMFDLWLPQAPTSAMENGESLEWINLQNNIYRFKVTINKQNKFEIK